MTRAEALAEARKRWGRQARAYSGRQPDGKMRRYLDPNICGERYQWETYEGDSWEAAFADADRRAK